MWGWEGLYGRPRGGEVVVFPQDISERNRDAGDHKGPPFPASAALAPTVVDEPFLRLMPLGRPLRSPGDNSRLLPNASLYGLIMETSHYIQD